MGKQAARMGDQTVHGTPLGPNGGSANVLIGGKPAWRAGMDFHTCPVSDPKPHVGGLVQKGSTTVMINGKPAVRVGDKVMESGGGPNDIISGASNVYIGG